MRVVCPDCGAKLDLEEAQLHAQGSESLPVRCWMCTRKLVHHELTSNDGGPPTVAIPAVREERSRASRLDKSLSSDSGTLALPQDETIKILAVNGRSQGAEWQLSRPLVTIGRLGGGADIEIDDPRVSRTHCAIEVRQDVILLHDLSSRNGTYIEDRRVLAGQLTDKSQFRIGSTFLQVGVLSLAAAREKKITRINRRA
jgi:pSer/pThr/pTyr-binding forkhead associated (FHA) protein